jgi:hypothetical protein
MRIRVRKRVKDIGSHIVYGDGKVFSKSAGMFVGFDALGYRAIWHNKKRVFIHRLVAIAFIPNPHNKPFVNHKDGNRANNNLANLEWCTHQENMIHARKSGFKSYRVLKEEEAADSLIGKDL